MTSTQAALLALVGYGITGFLYKVSSKYIDAVSMAVVMSAFSFTVMVPYWYTIRDKRVMTSTGIWYALLIGVVGGIAFMAYIKSIHLGKASVATTLRSLSFIVTSVLAVTLLDEELSSRQWIGIALAISAAICLYK